MQTADYVGEDWAWWKPTLSFKRLVEMMVDADLGRLRRANP